MIEQILYEKHPYFNMIFKEWIEKNKKDLSFSPLDLNTVYKKYQFKSNESEFLLNNDYNSLVDAIILIAPSYDKTLTAEINNDHETNQIKTNQMIENIDNIEESNLLPISYQTRSQSNNYLINQNFYSYISFK